MSNLQNIEDSNAFLIETNVLKDIECDSFFPELSDDFIKVNSGDMVLSKEHKILYNIDVYRNKFYNYTNQDVSRELFLKQVDKIGFYGVV